MPKIALTGAGGRLGRALNDLLRDATAECVSWSRPAYDLDDPRAAALAFKRDLPDIVLHAAAWTDVDGCARDPELALRRNGEAVGELALACANNGARLVLVSTNEVFDGERTDGRGYEERDPANPINAYGESKLAGEVAATEVFAASGAADDLLITRTAWLFGPPGHDFPAKIIAAADRLSADEPVRVVSDEVGSPTYTLDLAQTIVRLVLEHAPGGIYHLANEGAASRLDVAARVLGRCRPDRATTPISRKEFVRASTPPPWAVLENTRASALGIRLRSWEQAVDAYARLLCPD
jgi:dTDP-4-dehydrorhamnose reductase